MENTVLYVYAMTNDSGFAPCVQNNWLTLACCKGGKKGGLRKSAANDFIKGSDVWILGLCGKKLASDDKEKVYMPIYLARIDETILMTDYYADNGKCSGRKDNVYQVENEKLVPKKNNPHNQQDQEKDVGGQWVLASHNFVYWGDKCGSSGKEIEVEFPSIFHTSPDDKKKKGIDEHYRGYMVDRNFVGFVESVEKWEWFPPSGQCNKIGDSTNDDIRTDEDDNNEEEVKTCFSCCGKPGRKEI